MFALRQIHTVQSRRLLIQLPTEFDGYGEVEIIILPVEAGHKTRLTTGEFISRFAGSMPDFPEIESPAAIVRAHGVTLIAHNTGEFSRVPGLVLEDWQAAT